MAIVKMKRLRIIALSNERRQVIKDLTRLGCVEIERSDKWLTDPEMAGIMEKVIDEESHHAQEFSDVSVAMAALQKYAEAKKGILEPRQVVDEKQLYDEKMLADADTYAKQINKYAKEIAVLQSEESKCKSQKEALNPWIGTDIPIDFEAGKEFSLYFGMCPVTVNVEEMQSALGEIAKAAALDLVHSDKEQHYLILVSHNDYANDALECCKEKGFSITTLKGTPGTVAENIKALEERIEEIELEIEGLKEKIVEQKESYDILGFAYDSLMLVAQREDILSMVGNTKKTVSFEGWIPKYSEKEVAAVLDAHECAYEFLDPAEGEEPPVLLKNNGFVRPFGEITNLYGLPGALSLIDPNPFVAVSYFLFFGLMFSDAAYGLILFSVGLIVLKKAKPSGAFRNFMQLAVLVGISTTIWGFVFGSFFGDIIQVVTERITGTAWGLPALMDPLQDPMLMLFMSLGFGVVHLFVGLGLSVYRQIRRGEIIDAILDTIVWYIVIIGVLLFLVGVKPAIWVVVATLVVVAVTAGRNRKGIGKFTAGFGALYNNLAGFLSDILSYSRLMALSMATGVVASVFNTLGNMFGTSVIGWILLVAIFAVGQTFNFAINLLGAFVHSCRLQYVEFFGKFFEGGGRKFKPLYYNTKFIQIRREKN